MEGEIDRHLQRIYELYFDDVYHYLVYFTNSSSDAEDLTQDTFIRVFRNYQLFRSDSSIKTWIFSIAKRVAIDHYRKRKMLDIIPDWLLGTKKSNEYIPEIELDRDSDWELIQEALLKLKPDFRNVVILRGLKEFSTKETAEILNVSESKVKVDYHRALAQLRRYLKKSEEGVVTLYEQKFKG